MKKKHFLKVTELTSPSALTKSITNIFSNINKSVNSAFANLMTGSSTHPTEDTLRPQHSFTQGPPQQSFDHAHLDLCPTFRPSFSVGCLDQTGLSTDASSKKKEDINQGFFFNTFLEI